MGCTAPLTSKHCILYIYSTNTGTEYFKHVLYSLFFPLQNAVCFIMLTCLVPVLFTFYIQGVQKLKKNNSGAKGLKSVSWFRILNGERKDITVVFISLFLRYFLQIKEKCLFERLSKSKAKCQVLNTGQMPLKLLCNLNFQLHKAFFTEGHKSTFSYSPYTAVDIQQKKLQKLYAQTVTYPGILFGGGVQQIQLRTERERGSGGGSPLVKGSGGSCNLVQEISFHTVKFP